MATRPVIPAMSATAIRAVRALEERLLALPQVPIETRHVLHAGMYARTICVGCRPLADDTKGSAACRSSAARMTTDVVPSPTSVSWRFARSTRTCAGKRKRMEGDANS